MAQWVVTMWGATPDTTDRVVRVDAPHWLDALHVARRKAGVPIDGLGLRCKLDDERTITVYDDKFDQTFSLRPMTPNTALGAELFTASITLPARMEPKEREAPRAQATIARATPRDKSLLDDPFADGDPRTTGEIDRLLAAVFAHCQDLDLIDNRIDLLHFALDVAVAKIAAEAAALLLYDYDRQELRVAAARGPNADAMLERCVPMGSGVAGFTTQQGVALNIPDVSEQPRLRIDIDQGGGPTRAVVCAPITGGGRIFGAIELVNRVGKTSYFTDGELNALCYIGRRLGERLTAT